MESIAGIVFPDVFQIDQQLKPMLDILQRREDNIVDTFYHKNFHIGIIGAKLACNEKKNIVVALNGTLTNYEELHEELRKQGHPVPSMRSHANPYAQLVLSAYELWGANCMSRLSGEFALAIFDQNKERLLLSRDRIGAKPLYWYQDHHYFIFASELKALLSTEIVPQTPSNDAIASYLYFGYIPQDMTPIKNVNKLLPGHYLQLNRDKSIFIQSFWSYSSFFEKKNTESKSTVLKHLNELIIKSVKNRLPHNQMVGCFISGGIGSACIAEYIKKLGDPNQLYGFSVGFQGQNDPDIKTALEVAKILAIPHDVEQITPANLLESLVPIVWHLDEPLADPNIIAIWKMAKLAALKTKTVFSGMGSDELLAGHSRYTIEERHLNPFSKVFQHRIPYIKSLLVPLLNYFYPPAVYQLLKKLRTNPRQYEFLQHHAVFDERQLASAAPNLAGLFNSDVFLHKFHNLEKIKSTVASFLYFDVKTRLADCYIPQLKRLTAANNLNWQTPFLDHHLFEYLAGMPEPDQLSENETAAYLKTLLKDVYPPHILNRPKRTRPDFLQAWANEPELKQLWPLLLKGTLVEMGLISEVWLNAQIATPKSCEKSFKFLWSILILEVWFRLFINRSIQAKAPDIGVKELLAES